MQSIKGFCAGELWKTGLLRCVFGAQFKIVQFELRLVRRCLAARYWLLFALSEDRQTTPTRLAGGLQFYGTLPRRPACFCASHLWHSVRQESVVILVR